MRGNALGTGSYQRKTPVKAESVTKTTTYHEIDFLLATQRFNINFSYVTQRGLPFVREFVLRLVHLSPMTKTQLATFFGFSRKEAEEAISDLVERGELTLSHDGRLTLTEKASGYFTEVGEVPRLSLLQDSNARLTFDLATFTCLGREVPSEKWKAGIKVRIDDANAAKSEALAEKHFQHQFDEILGKNLLPEYLSKDEKALPTVYTVNSVNKVGQTPFRLRVNFQVDLSGKSLEREDFEVLRSSDYVHEQITLEIDRLQRPNNAMEIAKAMLSIGDQDTLRLLNSETNSINPHFLSDLNKLQANRQHKRTRFIGPIYSPANWKLLEETLAPILKAQNESKSDLAPASFIWLAPSDPYWGKSNLLLQSLSSVLSGASTKKKKLYLPTLYLPVSGPDDYRAIRQWKQELDPYTERANGITEGFLGGSVEVMHFEGKMAVVVYHLSLPEKYPVAVPLGFITADRKLVSAIGLIVRAYLQGGSSYGRPNDCGLLSLSRAE